MTSHPLKRLPFGMRLFAACAALLSAAPTRAQTDVLLPLEPVVVVATRTPDDLRTLGSAVDSLSAAELARQQLTTVAQALGAAPGSPTSVNGAAGADVSVFMRGSDSGQTLFLVDGIRLNDANTDYAVFLGGARLGASDSLEIVRGPQSTLYGSEAVGGVVSLRAQKGSGAAASNLSAGAGSFGTVSGAADSQGASGPWAWSFSGSGMRTANERPNNAFESGNLVVRLDRSLSAAVDVGATIRGFHGRYGDPGNVYTNDLYAHETESNWLGTLFADFRMAPDWTAHVTLGGQDRRYVSFDELPGVYSDTTTVQTRRAVLDAQATYSGLPAQKITVGFTGEDEATSDNGFGSIDRHQTLAAAFAQDEWHPAAPVFMTAGVRYDDFDTFGSTVTGRVTAAWLSASRSLKLRASYGTGFNAPSFLDLYGVATGYQGNPGLKPEHSRGGDAGADWYLPGGLGSIGASWFRNDLSDLIVFDFSSSPGTTRNVGRATTEGLEVSGRLEVGRGAQLRVSYTYLQADDVTDATRLLRRPRNSATADLWKDLGGGWSAGVGVRIVTGQADVDAQTYLTVNDPDYSVVRLYGAWRISPSLEITARVENLLDRKYQPVNGYPANGAGAFAGAAWRL